MTRCGQFLSEFPCYDLFVYSEAFPHSINRWRLALPLGLPWELSSLLSAPTQDDLIHCHEFPSLSPVLAVNVSSLSHGLCTTFSLITLLGCPKAYTMQRITIQIHFLIPHICILTEQHSPGQQLQIWEAIWLFSCSSPTLSVHFKALLCLLSTSYVH